METVDEVVEKAVLAHYGVKGMKWGQRRTRAQIDADSADAANAKAVKAKISRNGGRTDPVSNKELQELVTRMNLEQQYSKLSSQKKSSGADFARSLIVNVGKQQMQRVANDFAGQQVTEMLKKKR